MIYGLIITAEVDHEIEALSASDEDAAAELDLLIERLQEDQPELENLCLPGNRYGYHPAFEVKKFAAAQRAGRNIYLVKYRMPDGSLSPYRLFIGFNAQHGTYHALQVAHREDAYETGQPGYQELLDRCDKCGIPIYG